MKLWDTRNLFPDPCNHIWGAVRFGDFYPDAEGYPYIFSDYHLNEAIYHKKFINRSGLKWWIDVMEGARKIAIHK